MKQKIERTNTSTKRFSTRTIALILSIVMLIGSIVTGSMLSTFAAYLKDAAKADAVTQAAAEGGNIALNAIPSEDNADDADAKPDLSGFEENEIVRGMKADVVGTDADTALVSRAKKDLAGTGANADLAATGWSNTDGIAMSTKIYKNGTTEVSAWTSSGNNDGWCDFDIRTAGTYEYQIIGESSKWFGSVSGWNTPAYSDPGGSYNAHNNNGTKSNISATFPKGQYVLHLTGSGGSGDNNISYDLYRKKASIVSSKVGWTEPGTEMTYNNDKCYKYEFNGDGTDYYFRLNMNDGGTYTYFYPNTDGEQVGGNYDQGYNCGNTTNNTGKSFKIPTLSGGKYTIWLKIDGSTKRVWLTKDESGATKDYYLTGYVNGTDYSGDAYKFTGSGDNYTYTLTSTTASQYLTIKDSTGIAYHPGSHPAANGAAYTTTNTDPTANNKWGITSGAKGKSITFTWKPTSKTLSWTIGSSGDVDVYAKDGAAPINWDDKTKAGATSLSGITKDGKQQYYYNYARIATTSITSPTGATSVDCDILGGTSGSKYQFKSIASGTKITITTTIANENSWRTKYYVAGWCVNGITYKEGTDTVGVNANPSASKADYTFSYTIPDTDSLPKDAAGNPVVEITPIYYLQNKTNTVTFYIEGYTDVQTKWGNTPYVYPFYGNLSGYQNTFGAYPGQPVVNVGGQMSTEIPIYTNPIYASVASTVIKGVTISNGYADHVHRNLVYGWTTGSNVNDDKDHMQTYDFDDFYKIYAEHTDGSGEHPNAIFFRFREETTKYNRSTYGGSSTGGQFANGTSNINISTIASSGNGWELLKDRHDRPVNLFGDYEAVKNVSPSSATADTSKALYVVSTGYNANIAGDYGTMWKVYNGSGQLISTDSSNSRYGIPPSLLHVKGSTSGMTPSATYPDANRSVPGVGSYTDTHAKYNNIYKALKAAGYNNKIVYVTFEKDTQDTRNVSTGEGAYRVDGQWFYTFASDNVQSTIGIEYYNKSTGKWMTDTVSAATGKGTTTQATAQFNSDSYASASNVTTSKSTLTSAATTLNFTASESGVNYAFDGWFLKYDDSYDPITGATNVGSIKSTANYQLIARYIPVVTGSLTVSYKLDPTSTGTKDTMSLSVKYGSNAAVTGTLGDDGVYRATITGVTHTTTASNIVVTLTAKPKNHGKVSAFGADNHVPYSAQSSPTLPGGENTSVTKTYTFTNNDLYSEADHTNQLVTDLEYTAKIDATPHYYQFTYTFTDRGGATKNYTARGEITEDHYDEYVSGTTINDAFVKSRAPFESNFLKTLKLGSITKDYIIGTHTFTASATYGATPYTPMYDVKIKLPYDYYTTSSGTSYKRYNASSSTYKTNNPTFTLKASYDEFVTIDATSTKPGNQENVSKVTDSTDVNHTGNNFITAADKLGSKYFKYWEIKRLADTDAAQATAPVIARIYYPDLHYRFYADSYVEAVYTDNEAEYWSNVNGNNTELSASVLYLESSRNQYNTVANGTTDEAADAADIIYNDFIFNYRLGDKEFISSNDAEIGMVLERVKSSDGTKWVTGNSSVTNMDSYKAANAATENKNAIATFAGGGANPGGCVKQVWNNNELNNKNFTEQNYPAYAQYGQTVSDHSITFKNDGTMDNYVYRAWAYIIDKSNNNAVAVSDPAYFSMNYIAAQNYKAG